MAVKASGLITLAAVTDVSAVTPYYKAQTSTLSPPNKPTSVPPSGWATTQPSVDTSKTCYIVWLIFYSDRSWDYSDVSTFSEYEAAKAAQATADGALQIAQNTDQYFWFESTGQFAGAHITQVEKDSFKTTPAGGNVFIDSSGIEIRNAQTPLASFTSSGATVGETTKSHIVVEPGGIFIWGQDGSTGIAVLGYGAGADVDLPFYNFGQRYVSDGYIGEYSLIQGIGVMAKGDYSSAFGQSTEAIGEASHAEGTATEARGPQSHAEGYSTQAIGAYSHAAGLATEANYAAQTVVGMFNENRSDTLFEVGTGTDVDNPATKFAVGPSNIYIDGNTLGDYVVQQGKSGIWTYRKWASGVAECWGHTDVFSAAFTTKWGNAYYTSERQFSFPSGLFKSGTYPAVTCNVWDNGGLGWATIKTLNYTTVGFYLSNPASTTRSTQLYIHANGVWK